MVSIRGLGIKEKIKILNLYYRDQSNPENYIHFNSQLIDRLNEIYDNLYGQLWRECQHV